MRTSARAASSTSSGRPLHSSSFLAAGKAFDQYNTNTLLQFSLARSVSAMRAALCVSICVSQYLLLHYLPAVEKVHTLDVSFHSKSLPSFYLKSKLCAGWLVGVDFSCCFFSIFLFARPTVAERRRQSCACMHKIRHLCKWRVAIRDERTVAWAAVFVQFGWISQKRMRSVWSSVKKWGKPFSK